MGDDNAGCPHATTARGRSDRGASPVELAILLPVIFLLLMMSIQAGVYFLARAVALNAAQIGVNSTRTLAGDTEAGAEAKVLAYINAAPDWLVATSVDVNRNEAAGVATATVEGSVLQVMPGFSFTVRQNARGPIERFTPGD
ncbi:pilus assembly protein [Micromonospora sp. NBC_01699]|uniref:TadE/TadG family type IV pilus assembly protein n=1 Tax=Micromonospora sp. NBC_01699 TaxID=2975984 RepID=UPI002E2868AC|nr:TadE/TadG family type IV pilus assembly protein [Micromonospora sp. NBC_01699]